MFLRPNWTNLISIPRPQTLNPTHTNSRGIYPAIPLNLLRHRQKFGIQLHINQRTSLSIQSQKATSLQVLKTTSVSHSNMSSTNDTQLIEECIAFLTPNADIAGIGVHSPNCDHKLIPTGQDLSLLPNTPLHRSPLFPSCRRPV
jgi:hypothetical protein